MQLAEAFVKLWLDLLRQEDCLQRALDGLEGCKDPLGLVEYVERQVRLAQELRYSILSEVRRICSEMSVHLP